MKQGIYLFSLFFNIDHETISLPLCILSRNELKLWLELRNKSLQSSSKWDDLKKHFSDLTEFHAFHEFSTGGTYIPIQRLKILEAFIVIKLWYMKYIKKMHNKRKNFL